MKKYLDTLFSTPLVVLFVIYLSLYAAEFNENPNLDVFLTAVSVIFLVGSVVHTLILKKWKRFFKYVAAHSCVLLFVGCLNVMSPLIGPNLYIGDKEFYDSRFYNHTSIELDEKYKLYCEMDTIIGIGPGGGDYNAMCVYSVDASLISKIEKKIGVDTNFVKLKTSEFKTFNNREINEKLQCLKNINLNDYGYQYSDRYMMFAYIIFSKNKKYMLFVVNYY